MKDLVLRSDFGDREVSLVLSHTDGNVEDDYPVSVDAWDGPFLASRRELKQVRDWLSLYLKNHKPSKRKAKR